MTSEPALFVPLKAEHFDAFERGDKTEEFRPLGPRWNERTCRIGRAVILSRGYGSHRRLSGTVVGFRVSEEPSKTAAWTDCYGAGPAVAVACIAIEVRR